MINTIETIYQSIYETASNTVMKKLAILRDACESQVRGNSSDYTIATIGRISESMGGVKAQTIRNNSRSGNTYRKLICAYRARYSKTTPKSTKNDDPMHSVSCIEDTRIRLMMLEVIAEKKKLQNELNILKNVTVIELDRRLGYNQNANFLPEYKLSELEVKALTNFISDHRLKDLNWKKGSNGRLVNAFGRPTTKPFFVDAIEKLRSESEV